MQDSFPLLNHNSHGKVRSYKFSVMFRQPNTEQMAFCTGSIQNATFLFPIQNESVFYRTGGNPSHMACRVACHEEFCVASQVSCCVACCMTCHVACFMVCYQVFGVTQVVLHGLSCGV